MGLLKFLLLVTIYFFSFESSAIATDKTSEIYKSDQATRRLYDKTKPFVRKDEREADAVRRIQILEILAENNTLSPQELIQAAIVLQHTNTEYEKIDKEKFRSQDNHLLAFFLARKAYKFHHPDAAWVMVVCVNRWLRINDINIKYGIEVKEEGAQKKVALIDANLTQFERAHSGIPFDIPAAISNLDAQNSHAE